MHYEVPSEKTSVTAVPTTTEDYKQNRDVKRARIAVLVLLGIQLFFSIFYFIGKLVTLIQYYNISSVTRDPKLAGSYIGSFIGAGISVLYIILFIIVVVKYIRVGILIFAWLGLLELIAILIVIILTIIAVIAVAAAADSAGAGIVISIIIIVIAGIGCILTILTVVFSFKLAKLIKAHRGYQYV